MTTIQTIPLSQLSVSDINVRKTGRGAEPEFTASIREKGVIEPLIVRKNGKGFTITNGSKRFDALVWLREKEEESQGKPVTGDFPVPVIVREESDEDARDTSLIVNIVRSGMHPADEVEAFAQQKAAGKSIGDIAALYGIDERRVRQRLALGQLAPCILDAWRKGHMTAETAQAFTLAASKKEQEKIFKQLSDDEDLDAWNVKDAVAGDRNGDVGQLVAFVGIDAYVKRGGKVTEDLFGTDHIVSDEKLARTMADERMEAECTKLVADGWSFAVHKGKVRDSWNYGRITNNVKLTKEEEDRIAQLQPVSDADDGDRSDMARDEIERIQYEASIRSFTKEQKARSGCFVSIGRDGSLEVEPGYIKPAEKTKAKEAEKTERAAERKAGKDTGPEKKVPEPRALSNAMLERLRVQRLKAIKACIVEDHSDADELVQLLAKIIASQIKPDRPSWMPREVGDNLEKIASLMTGAKINAHLRKAFDANDYFSGAPKSFVLKAITEAVNADEARKIGGKTKADIAKFALANVVKNGWLPPELRTAHYDGPGGKAATKTKKKR